MLTRRSALLAPILAPIAVHAARAESLAPADLVLVRQGTLPIILTVPHGGREAIPGVAPRDTRGKPSGGRGFVTVTDTNTDRLALGIAAEIKALTGRELYLVMAKFKRTFVDPNRPPEVAVDSPAARPYYDFYHQAVRRFIDEVRGKYPAGALLVDVHGQKKDPTVVMRGTQNGRTVARLIERAGIPAVTGPNGIFGQLAANGLDVFPSNDAAPEGTAENAGFNGGYTVGTYSQNADGIDAVQMEFGTRYRHDAGLDLAARATGTALVAFYEAYLKPGH
jgi:N-formylglutamate amidohydrolase